jgi:hypothetical protein
VRTARFEPSRKLDRALAIGELDRQHLTAVFPIDADRNQHPCLAHLLIARVEDQIGDGFGQAAAGKLRQSDIIPGGRF